MTKRFGVCVTVLPLLLASVPPGFNDCSDHLEEQQAERITICAWPAQQGWPDDIRTLEWNAAPGWQAGTTKHRIRYSSAPNFWCAADKVDVAASACSNVPPPPIRTPRCLYPYEVQTGWTLTFIRINTLVNGTSEVVPPDMVIGGCP